METELIMNWGKLSCLVKQSASPPPPARLIGKWISGNYIWQTAANLAANIQISPGQIFAGFSAEH